MHGYEKKELGDTSLDLFIYYVVQLNCKKQLRDMNTSFKGHLYFFFSPHLGNVLYMEGS